MRYSRARGKRPLTLADVCTQLNRALAEIKRGEDMLQQFDGDRRAMLNALRMLDAGYRSVDAIRRSLGAHHNGTDPEAAFSEGFEAVRYDFSEFEREEA